MSSYRLLSAFFLLFVTGVNSVVFQGSCADPAVHCEQLCLTLNPDTYECGCWNDHYLLPDGVGCRVNISSFHVFHHSGDSVVAASRPLSFQGNNYAEFPLVDSAYLETNVTIEFKITDQRDGILLFAGQMKGDDYLSIALIGPNIVLRHDCGEGAIEDLYRGPFAVAEWHNITVWRRYCDRTEMRADKKTRMVDLTEQFKYYKGITMDEGIFVGGAPTNIEFLDTKAGTDRGITGCVRKVVINEEVLLDTVTTRNQALNTASLEYCGAPPKYVDPSEFVGFEIATGTEPPRTEAVDVSLPLRVAEFSGSSFVSLPAPSSVSDYMELVLHIKPSQQNGLVFLWQRESQAVAVSLRKGFAHVYATMGADSVILRSESVLSLHQWHKIEVWRSGKGILLKVNRQAWVESELASLGAEAVSVGEIHVGGTNSSLPAQMQSIQGYHGCIKHIRLNGRALSIPRSSGLRECGADPCASAGCPNTCASRNDEFVCLCEWPTHGTKCEKTSSESLSAMRFEGHSYLEFSGEKNMNQVTGDSLRLSIELKLNNETSSKPTNQLLAFAGDDASHADFLRLEITPENKIKFTTNLGSGSVELVHPTAISTESWHNVGVRRDQRHVTLSVDGMNHITTVAPEGSEQLNVYSSLFIGGIPSETLSGEGLRGCIQSIDVGNLSFFYPKQAQSAINIRDCCDQ